MASPISTGDWGRPASDGRQHTHADAQTLAPEAISRLPGLRSTSAPEALFHLPRLPSAPAPFEPTPPPPPPPGPARGQRRPPAQRRRLPLQLHRRHNRPEQRRGWRQRRPITAGIEAGVAIAVLVTVALASAGGGPSHEPGPSASMTAWSGTAVPTITNLIDDMRAIDVDLAPPVPAPALAGDTASLRSDLAGARRLPTPPEARAEQAWARSLAQAGAALAELAHAGHHPGRADLTVARRKLDEAASSLLQLGSLLQGGRRR